MSLDSRIDRLAADQQLNAACQAITASVAMLRATELQVHEIQDRQGFSPEEATLLCEQVVALRDLLKLRLDEMDSGAKLDGPISRGPSPSRVTAGSRVAWVGEQQHRGGSVPAARMGASQDRASSFKQIRRGPAACSKPSTLPQLIPQLMEAEVEAEVLPLLETISAVLIDLDGTMYSPHGPISGADGALASHAPPTSPHPTASMRQHSASPMSLGVVIPPKTTPTAPPPSPSLPSAASRLPPPPPLPCHTAPTRHPLRSFTTPAPEQSSTPFWCIARSRTSSSPTPAPRAARAPRPSSPRWVS